MELLNKIRKINRNHSISIFVIVVVLVLSIPTLFSNKHFLYNLEPYPDGLFYTLSAKNLVENGRLTLEYKGIGTYISQPPLYSLVLSLGYLVWHTPASFYLINIVLLIGTFVSISQIIVNQKISYVAKCIATLFLVTHGYFYLLLSLPMTENLTLFLFSLGLYSITQVTFKKIDFIKLVIISIALVLTRLSIIPTAVMFLLIGLYKLYPQLSKKEKQLYAVLLITGVAITNFAFTLFLNKSLFSYFIYFFQESFLSTKEHSFYNNSYIFQNVTAYLQTLLGQKANFLWFMYPLTSVSIAVAITTNLVSSSKQQLKKILPISLLLFSLFSLLLTFYLSDSRYIIYVIPALIVIFAKTLPQKIKQPQLVFFIALLFFHIYTQAPIFKQILADNIFHKSTAWQYEAAKQIDSFATEHKNIQLITTLPPHLVEAYSNNSFELLPLSHQQEFLQKKQYIWGDTIHYENLTEYYQKELEQGTELYITNAYVTHQQSVIEDFEYYKKKFNLTLEKEGCLNTCNIYKLELSNAETL